MSSYTSEIVVGSAIVAALGVAAYLLIRPAPAQPDENLPSTTQKRQLKKKKPALQDSLHEKPLPPPPAPRIPKPAATIPGGFAPLDNDELSAASGSNAGSAKRKKKKPVKKATGNSATVTHLGGSIQPGTAAASTQQHLLPPEYSVQESKTDKAPWTRVESRRKTSSGAPESASDAGVTTSVTEEEGSITENKERSVEKKLTLAEKLLAPPPETAVDDMLEGPKPGIARVLRVPQNYDRPSGTAEWGDYEDAEDVRGVDPDTDDGWSVVPEKAKRPTRAGGSGYASAASVTVTAPTAASGSESQSKHAKKNAKRKDAAKAVKAANEVAQQDALAKHKREQEAARIAEQFKTKSKQSGGMSAGVNDKGQLVWE